MAEVSFPRRDSIQDSKLSMKNERVRKEASQIKIDDLATERALESLTRATRLEIFKVQYQRPAFSTELSRIRPEPSDIVPGSQASLAELAFRFL